MQIHNFEQHSDEWYNIRLGKFTASKAATIATAGTGLETLCFDLVAEILTKKKKETFSNAAMEQGNELEATARTLFELQTGKKVEQVGFVEIDEFSGCSPDGLTEDAGVEIKCPQDSTYAKYLYDEKIKPEYYAQMQMQMLFCGREKWFYVVYNPNFEQEIVIKEVAADKDFQKKILDGLEKGKTRLKEILGKIQADKTDFWTELLKPETQINDYRI